jgi:stage V sporulation protein G
MEITDIRIRKLIYEGKLKAIVSVTVDDTFAIHDIKIIQGQNRLFAAMPSRRDENGIYRDIVHPITSAGRAAFEKAILDAYYRALEEGQYNQAGLFGKKTHTQSTDATTATQSMQDDKTIISE